MQVTDLVLREDVASIAHLTLNSPSNLNALSDEMLAALHARLDDIADSTMKVVVIKGAGKAFCAGHDLRQMQTARQSEDAGRAAWLDLFKRCSSLMARIRTLPQPVIAQVHGIAAAAGCQLVATCDLAVSSEDARFGVNGVNIGLFCSTPMVALSRNIARKQAFELLTTGRLIEAPEAMQMGLINQSVPADSLQQATEKLAETLSSKLGSAVRIGKEAFYAQIEMEIDDAYAYTGQVMAANMAIDDTNEGIQAFLEKRAPNWDS